MTAHDDVAVIGAGIVGTAIAYGLRQRGLATTLYDGNARDFRASRGNFGLAWVQGKGLNCPQYSELSRQSAAMWESFAQRLLAESGIDCGFRHSGGLNLCLDQDALARSEATVQAIHRQNPRLGYEVWDSARLRRRVPAVSERVVGAIYSSHDGHANPLNTLRALALAFQRRGGRYLPATPINAIEPGGPGFILQGERGEFRAGRVVLAAGLDNMRLAAQLGLNLPIEPVRGQILVTERTAPFLPFATNMVRQTLEGSVLIGDSQEHDGLNTGTRPDVLARIARRALLAFPHLEQVNVVRAWGALRIMTPDGLPVYDASTRHPGAFAVTCHSGVTLAALHSTLLPDWIAGGPRHQLLEVFNAQRFALPSPALG